MSPTSPPTRRANARWATRSRYCRSGTRSSSLSVPDIAVVDRAAVSRGTPAAPLEAMLLLGEILSPISQAPDRILKPALYAQAKVPAYWRIELEPDVCVVVHELEGGSYREIATVTGKESVQVAGEFTVDLDVAALGRELKG
ncbi:Uma2 family endonuclease [Streptomyces sp. Inha503]|uniref:Uma2 family endonuclease n=1 Tax=Streptomyces sp. Inha503 TaxID=3383314 RepID=UPI00399FD33F